MVADPRRVAAAWPDVRVRVLAELAAIVTEAPWQLSRAHLQRAHTAGLTDDEVVHAVALASLFGHLNRIADAVGVPLDYDVAHPPPATDPTVPALAAAPGPLLGESGLDLARRPATAAALASWHGYIMARDVPLSARQRALIARAVASWLGDGRVAVAPTTVGGLDEALLELARQVTLAPWQLSDTSFAVLRTGDFDDEMLFDVCATASTVGVLSRIHVALTALSRAG